VSSAVALGAFAVFFALSNTILMFTNLEAKNDGWTYYFLTVALIAFPAAAILAPALAAARGIKWGVAVIATIVTAFFFGTPVVLLFFEGGMAATLPWILLVSWGGVAYLRRVIPYLRSGNRRVVFYDCWQDLQKSSTNFQALRNLKVASLNKRIKAMLSIILAIPAGAALWFLAGVIIYLFIYFATGSFDLDEKTTSALNVGSLIGVITIVWFIVRHGLRYITPSAAVVLHDDRRPQILLLRSFKDENISMYRFGDIFFFSLVPPMARWLLFRQRLDEFFEKSLRSYGPVTAVGRPKEALPSLGAAREYASDDNWMSLVEMRIRQAKLVIAILGSTEGFAWEMSAVLRLSARGKLIMVVPPKLREHELSEQWVKISKALEVEFDLPAQAIMVSWEGDTMTVLTADKKCRQAAGYRMALAWLLGVRHSADQHSVSRHFPEDAGLGALRRPV
jgi:hypothetical protein